MEDKMDPVIIASLIGVAGTLLGALLGTLLGAKLGDRKAKIDVFIDNILTVYYLRDKFCVYVPLTITNEGNRSAAIAQILALIKSPSGQEWRLVWSCFATPPPSHEENWVDGQVPVAILAHGNSGVQHHLKLIEIENPTTDGFSQVFLSPGNYHLTLYATGRDGRITSEGKYTFKIDTEMSEDLAIKRKNYEDFQSWFFSVFPAP